MKAPYLLRAWRFFFREAGWSEPPGRAACALALAKAERDGLAEGLTAEWVDDPFPWEPMSDEDTGPEHSWEECIVRGPDGEFLAQLGGIGDADASYRRVVRAELFYEALAELARRESRSVRAI